jgi:maltose O-acetyltransferase
MGSQVRFRLGHPGTDVATLSAPLEPAPAVAPPAGRVRSTLQRVGAHALHLLSNVVGDDIGGRLVRRGAIRLAGAHVPRSAHVLGGTYLSRAANLRLGERCLINRNCYLDLCGPITIGDDAVVGHGTSIITARHRVGPSQRRAGSVEGAGVVIGAGAWIGANATVLPGVAIGPGAIVAAGAVVTADVPADTLVAGAPARHVRDL